MSLNNQSGGLSELGRREDALTAIDEALRLVLPVLERAPYVLPAAGLGLVRGYVTRCEEAEREPDGELVERMHAVLLARGGHRGRRVVADDTSGDAHSRTYGRPRSAGGR
jgi:hypothetical protein